jgi:hypothetical protein
MTDERMVVELENEETSERNTQKQAPWWVWPLVVMIAVFVLALAWNPWPLAEAEEGQKTETQQTVEPEVLAEAIAIAIVSQQTGSSTSTVVTTDCGTTSGSQLEEAIAVVRFVDGWDANGKFIAKGSTINGPAIIKPNPNTPDFIAVYPKASYVLEVDSVVWLYEANPAGLESQFQFFGELLKAIKP